MSTLEALLPRGPLPSALVVRQRICFDTGRCSYVVACARTRAAALIDPAPSLQAELREVIEAHDLKVRYVLETHLPEEEAPTPRPARRYEDLLQSLGAAPLPDGPKAAPICWWSDLPRIGPVARPTPCGPAHPDSILLQAGAGHVGLRLHSAPSCGTHCTLTGSLLDRDDCRICCQLHIAVGAWHLQVLPLPDRDGSVAYQVADRVFSGTPLTSRTPKRPGTSPSLLTLPGDTIVHPSLLTAGMSISSISQEVRWIESNHSRAGEDRATESPPHDRPRRHRRWQG